MTEVPEAVTWMHAFVPSEYSKKKAGAHVPGLARRLTEEERRERSRVYLLDTAALGTLLALVVALSFATYLLFHSFTAHRLMLRARWRERGEAALGAGQPQVAIDDLHSALAYAPDDRGLRIELAKALAAAGRTQEAQAYFNTLLESEPGSGDINLQLGRLYARVGNLEAAVDHYQAAIDGTWNGDAFTQRRQIRLELARYLIAQHRDAEARSLLLITSGNGPDNYPLQLEVGGLLEQAGDSAADALDVYRKAAAHRATRFPALLGEARAANTLGRFAQERALLQQAVNEPDFAKGEPQVRDAARERLERADALLALFPAETLPNTERARRIGHIAELAQQRLLGCPAGVEAQAGAVAPPSGAPAGSVAPTPPAEAPNTALAGLAGLAQHLQQLNPLAPKSSAAPTPVPPTVDPLGTLAARWTALPIGAALLQALQHDPGFARNVLELAYETERATANGCGVPTGEGEMLLRIAEAPDQVEARG